MKPKIVGILQGVHMGIGHDGIAHAVKSNLKIDVKKLKDGELVFLLNRVGDKMKVMGNKGLVVGYLRMPDGQLIMREALRYIPETFGGTGFDYDAAVNRALENHFKGIRPTKTIPRVPLPGATA